MAMSVTVPLHLLEDIFRLLIYLDDLDRNDVMHFHKTGYSQRFEHDTALWELKLKIRQLQPQIVDSYLLTVDNITDDETRDLKKWVADGRSVYDNPCLISDESGRPMDFINACRLDVEMSEDLPPFFWDDLDDADNGDWDGDLPF